MEGLSFTKDGEITPVSFSAGGLVDQSTSNISNVTCLLISPLRLCGANNTFSLPREII